MTITIKSVEKGEPGVVGGGKTKFYAYAKTTGEINLDELSKLIEMISTVSDIDVSGVLRGLVKVAPLELAKGKIVRLGDLGPLRISISSEGHETEEEVGANSVTDARLIYTPGKVMKKMLRNLEYVMVNGEA